MVATSSVVTGAAGRSATRPPYQGSTEANSPETAVSSGFFGIVQIGIDRPVSLTAAASVSAARRIRDSSLALKKKGRRNGQ